MNHGEDKQLLFSGWAILAGMEQKRLGQTGVLEKRVMDDLYRSIGYKERTESGDSLSERYCKGCRSSDDVTLMGLKGKMGSKNKGGS